MRKKVKNLSDTAVAVTLTGEEWTALMAKMGNVVMSDHGREVYRAVSKKLAVQVMAASERVLVAQGRKKSDLQQLRDDEASERNGLKQVGEP